MLKPWFISVCKNVIQRNNKIIREGRDEPLDPPIRFQLGKSGGRNVCNEAELLVDGKVVGRIFYKPDKAILKHGPKVVIEFYGEVKAVT